MIAWESGVAERVYKRAWCAANTPGLLLSNALQGEVKGERAEPGHVEVIEHENDEDDHQQE